MPLAPCGLKGGLLPASIPRGRNDSGARKDTESSLRVVQRRGSP